MFDADVRWMQDAACSTVETDDAEAAAADPFFGVRRAVDRAKQICATCPVQEPCLGYALEHRIEHGVWGGTSARERKRMRAEAAASARAA